MQKVKHIVKELFIGAIVLLIFSNIISYIRKPTLDSNQVPDLNVRLLDGTSYKQKKNNLLVVHFWGTWCPTCKLEAANIEHVSKRYEVISIAVNSGSDTKIKAYMTERELSFPVVNDRDSTLAKQFKVEAYPTTFIYDAKGELRFTEVGYTSTAGLFARLKMIEK